MCTTGLQCPKRPEGDIRFPRTRIIDGCKPQWGCWELNPGSLQ